MSSPAPGSSPAPTSQSSPTAPPPPPSSTNSSASSKGLPPGTIAGMAVGSGFGGLVVLIAAVIFFLWYRGKKKKEAMRFAAGVPLPMGPKKDDLNTGPHQNWHQSDTPQADSKVALLPKPSPPSGVLAYPEVGPTPQPPLTSSSLDFKKPHHSPSPSIGLGFLERIFSYEELSKATDGFADTNLLGQGGFGYVHKGVLRNGKIVAIKQLKSGSGQGEREFGAEIEVISHVHHRHLVSLVGYCISGAQRMLVYEFVPNNNLEFHLHGKGVPTMNWSTRMKIALGAAKGLAYLHEDCQPKIIHRDIKASNILLDDSYEAKVADFGLAKYSLDTDTHVSTRVMGTFGYMAPEYASTGKLTDKSDVFSFGVVLLELITGHRPVDRNPSFYDDSIVDWARPLLMRALEDGNYDALADPKLQKDYDCNEMARMIACAAACVRHSARLRPRMSQIVRALEGNISLDELNEGMAPGYSTMYGSYGSLDYSSSQYQEDLRKFRKIALESREFASSSQYSGATSEHGQHTSGSSTEDGQATQEMEPPKLEKST